jgi:hypothetical protein
MTVIPQAWGERQPRRTPRRMTVARAPRRALVSPRRGSPRTLATWGGRGSAASMGGSAARETRSEGRGHGGCVARRGRAGVLSTAWSIRKNETRAARGECIVEPPGLSRRNGGWRSVVLRLVSRSAPPLGDGGVEQGGPAPHLRHAAAGAPKERPGLAGRSRSQGRWQPASARTSISNFDPSLQHLSLQAPSLSSPQGWPKPARAGGDTRKSLRHGSFLRVLIAGVHGRWISLAPAPGKGERQVNGEHLSMRQARSKAMKIRTLHEQQQSDHGRLAGAEVNGQVNTPAISGGEQ